MPRASTSSERTPLVQPAYVFESSIARRYQRRLKNLQCAICIALVTLLLLIHRTALSVALLVTVSYSLANDVADDGGTTTVTPPATIGNLTQVPPGLESLLKLNWPLEAKPNPPWLAEDTPSPETVSAAVAQGILALATKKLMESSRSPLLVDSPAGRAQRAAATSKLVKPLADAAYAVEEATRVLVNGTEVPHNGNVGVGPPTNETWAEPNYCQNVGPACPITKYRTIDGTCNNLAHALRWGVAYTPFRRALPPAYADGISSPRIGMNRSSLPSARDISVTVHRPRYAHDTSFTVMLAVWGQFIDHDITATALSKGVNSSSLSCCDHTQPFHPECFPVQLDKEDPFYQDYNVTCMEFVRSAPAPICRFGPREQLNQATAFIDASTVYGYTEERARRLRTGADGLLRMMRSGSRELLPPSEDPNDGCNTNEMNQQGRYCFESGDDRANENLHLTTMHLIWARQHNRLASILLKLNPNWNDERLYQETRRILGAQMQHITYSEFLPLVLGSDVMRALNLSIQNSGHTNIYNSTVNPSIANHFSAAAFRFAHTLLPGMIHNPDTSSGSVNYVHLHEMLFNPYALYRDRGATHSVRSALTTPVHGVDPHVTAELTNHLFERPVTNMSTFMKKPSPCGLDLVSLNIQRGRDHGLPAYPAWREHCGYQRPRSFNALKGVFDEYSLGSISAIYSSVDDIDLYTGALAEDPRGRLLGPTLSCLLADQFLRLKVGDRYWYETGDPDVGFTIEKLTEIRKTTLAGVICSNEAQLETAQPRVMELVGATNTLVRCVDISQPDWRVWATPDKKEN